MKNELLTVAEASARITAGDVMTVAGDTALLSQLPAGNWIGGSSVYFVTESGGAVIRDKVFCTTFEGTAGATVRTVSSDNLKSIAEGYKAGGFTVMLIPAFSGTHTKFAVDAPAMGSLFAQPLVGWISGVHLDELGSAKPTVYDGSTATAVEDGAVCLHIQLPAGSKVNTDIVNIFNQGHDAKTTFTFQEQGFSVTTAVVNGMEVNFAEYLTENNIDTRLPLVANYAGALVNVSVQAVDTDNGTVAFYAPVTPGVEYQLASPISDYAGTFASNLGDTGVGQYSCNCILNYLYGELEGKSTGTFTGPVTFGEIAYILLNQTLVKLDVQAA
ncbi:DUF6976 family protein [Donghicola mangrovi]|uniref:Uncharacterized protein n=1 Tax=Donghicola mangrovi TaxID=2729614 RepID=A0A850QBN0_9RHOB|nr:hypothetical protein [Donghicola mangrovi]NVO23649.1 hypothetical protein [Donghicola mangrovi]